MVVGGNIAVLREDKAGTGGGGGGGLTENIDRCVDCNAHTGGKVRGVELFRRHRLAVVGVDHSLYLGPLLLIDGGSVLGFCHTVIEVGPAYTGSAPGNGAGQYQSYNFGRAALFLFGGTTGAEGGAGHNRGRVHIAAEAASVAVVFVVVKVEFFHDKRSFRNGSSFPLN